MRQVLLSVVVAFSAASLASGQPKPVNLPLNTDKDEDDPHLSSDGLRLLYVSNPNKKWEIMSSRRKSVKEAWPAGMAIVELKSKEGDFRSPFLTPGGKYPQYLYYATNRDIEQRDRKSDNYDLYFLLKLKPQDEFAFENAVISADTAVDEVNPWLTNDKLQLYFSRMTKDGWHLYVTSRPRDGGQFGPPVRIEFPDNFHHACLSPDGKTMYLTGSFDGKRWRLFRATHNGTKWQLPKPLSALNTRKAPTGDRSPCLSRDGKSLYFVSDRPGGKGGLDIWMVPTDALK